MEKTFKFDSVDVSRLAIRGYNTTADIMVDDVVINCRIVCDQQDNYYLEYSVKNEAENNSSDG